MGASHRVFGVFETQGAEGLTTSSAGVGVRSCTSSFEITLSGSRGASPAPLKAALIQSEGLLFSPKDFYYDDNFLPR
ncbi:Uncharacterized protein HZ326_25870 [Fusarium oxysporum f. sp. albedinis]|nr:Uncharacterized protein HZ326_25870 [Fusarium oxysporum f. sp. albedinis]